MINPYMETFLRNVTAIYALGDSMTAGQNASPTSNSYINRFATQRGLTTTNIAISGRGVQGQIQAVKSVSYSRLTTLITAMVGFNDFRRGGSNAKTLKKVEAGFRYFITKYISSSTQASGRSDITRVGSFGSPAQTTNGFVYGTGTLPGNFATSSSTAGSYWEWTFSGTGCGIVFGALDGVVATGWGVANIYVDGVLHGTFNSVGWYDGISDGVNANSIGVVPYFITGLSNASHVIKVEAQTSANVVIDFFFPFISPSIVASMLLFEIPYMDATGYAIAPAAGTSPIFDTGSAVIQSLVTEFATLGYRIAYVQTNDFYDLVTGLDTDHIHPNNTGHAQIKDAMIAITG